MVDPAAMSTVAAISSLPAPWPAQAEEFVRELATQRRLSSHTLKAYRGDLQQLFALIGDQRAAPARGKSSVDPARVQAADVRRAAARLHARGLAPASLARTLSAWRSFYLWLATRGEIEVNPVTGVRAPKRAQRLPKALGVEQAVQLAAHEAGAEPLALADKAMVELLYSSGLRVSELASLDRAHFPAGGGQLASSGWIDLAGAEVTVTGKGGKRRSVPIGRAAVDALRAWLRARDSLPPIAARALFVTARGARIGVRSIARRVAAVARKAGLDVHVHPHVLRHSVASHLLQSSGDLRAVQELLGHANISTTQIYTKLDWQHLARAYDAAHPRARRKA